MAILQRGGYKIIEACDGPEALEQMGNGDPIDLLFTDLVLPKGMNGMELAIEAEKSQPGLNTLFTTGYAENAALPDDRLGKDANLISKPYRRTDLLDKVRSVLDSAKK